MGKRTVAENSFQDSIEDVLQEVLDILESNDGKPFEEKKKTACDLLRKHRDPVLADRLVECAVADGNGRKLKTTFWQSGERISAGRDIVLRKVERADREGFLGLQGEYSVLKSMLREESYCNMVWNEHTEDKALMLSIVRNGNYIGYCGIKNLTQYPWEIAIELQPEWTKHGIGSVAITAMLHEIQSRLGVTEYRVRIDPGNYASQRLFEKLGAVPNGISELWIHDQELLLKCEEDNLHLIDDQIISIAEKFRVEPRKLLSHVLEYTLTWKGRQDTLRY